MKTMITAMMLSMAMLSVFAADEDEFMIKPVIPAKPAEVKSNSKPKAKEAQPRKCFRCKGAGTIKVATNETCPRCEGTGIVVSEVKLKDTVHNYYYWRETTTRTAKNKQPCPQCKRRGKIPVKKDVECSSCKGEGWLLNGKPYSHND